MQVLNYCKKKKNSEAYSNRLFAFPQKPLSKRQSLNFFPIKSFRMMSEQKRAFRAASLKFQSNILL